VRTTLLPPASYASVLTKRLRAPIVAWRHAQAETADFDPGSVYCCHQPYEDSTLYSDETRIELADRYGGVGVGRAGGSGRCGVHGGLQAKGVGVTPLVAPDAGRYHSSGTLTLVEAGIEAVYASVYSHCLPFGAVPVLAVVATGGTFNPGYDHDSRARCMRALAFRPFVARPAHFMRNLGFPSGKLAAEASSSAGWTADACRVREAQSMLARNFIEALQLECEAADEVLAIDAGLRELARRLAWQGAASFAKRLPHGTLSCSNLALSGEYMDFGLTNHVPSYRRVAMPPLWMDTWNEAEAPMRTLMSFRRQLDSYRPGVKGSRVVSAEELREIYVTQYDLRVAVEMAKMSGLSEDLVSLCPSELLMRWLKTMQEIWSRGARERHAAYPGRMADGSAASPTISMGRYDLNEVLSVAGQHAGAKLNSVVESLLDDDHLARRFCCEALSVRQAIRSALGEIGSQLDSHV
jgi:hypothetical protein